MALDKPKPTNKNNDWLSCNSNENALPIIIIPIPSSNQISFDDDNQYILFTTINALLNRLYLYQ